MSNFKLTMNLLLILAFGTNAFAFTFYKKDKSPSEISQYGNRYQSQFGYSQQNNLHPYSTFQNPYNKNSARNNAEVYSAKVQSYGSEQSYGYVNSQLNQNKGINNPYSIEGNVYNPYHPAYPYGTQKPYSPYSKFQNPYNPNSLRNDPRYDIQYEDSDGKKLNGDSTSFNNSPFNNNSIQNPYSKNKNLIP